MKDTEVKRLLYQNSEAFKEGIKVGRKEALELVKKMRDAQTEKDIIEMMVRFKIEEEEEIDEKLNIEYATAMTSVVFYEDKVDELIKEME